MIWLRRHWGSVVTLALISVALWNGVRSIDFGFHWDEPVHLETVKVALADQTFLPAGFYHYPSFLFFLTVVVRLGQRSLESIGMGQNDQDFILLGRSLFLLLTVSGAAFLYAAGRRLIGPIAGVSAVVVYLFSWQLTYHARWIAPDALLASIGALFIWTLVRRATTPQAPLARLAPYLAAGLAASTKYQGAFLVLGAIAIDFLLPNGKTIKDSLVQTLKGLSGFLITFIVITPGVIIQPLKVYAAIRDRAEHYADGHGFYFDAESEVIENPLRFGAALLRSIAFDFASSQFWLSITVFIAALAGLVILSRERPRLTVALMVGPAIFFLYSLTLVVFIVRNFLLFLPFLAILAGIAVGAMWTSRTAPRTLKWTVGVVIICYTVVGLTSQTIDATEIRNRGPQQLASLIKDYVNEADTSVCIRSTSAVQALMSEQGIVSSERKPLAAEDQVFLVLTSQFVHDMPISLDEWPGTESRWFKQIGTREVDYSYYPRWSGDARALVLTTDQLAFTGLDEFEQRTLGVTSGCLTVADQSQ